MLDDVRAVVTAMEPFEKGYSWRQASVCVKSHSERQKTITVEMHPSEGSTFTASADTLPAVVRDLTANSDALKNALSPFSYEKAKP